MKEIEQDLARVLRAENFHAMIELCDPSTAAERFERRIGDFLAGIDEIAVRKYYRRGEDRKKRRKRPGLAALRAQIDEKNAALKSFDPASFEAQSIRKEKKLLLKLLRVEKKATKEVESMREASFIRRKFTNDPHRAVASLFAEPAGSPTFDKETCEDYYRKTLSDPDRMHEYKFEDWMPRCPTPKKGYDWFDIRVGAVNQALKRCKSHSAPGGDGITYNDYKMLRGAVAPYISHLFARVQQTGQVPDVWKYGLIKLLMKDRNGSPALPDNFRPICLTNTLGKLFMSMFARSLANWCTENGIIRTDMQKGFLPRVSGTIEHAYRVMGAVHNARTGRRKIIQVFLDLKNAFGSVAHGHILFALARANLPLPVQQLVQDYYAGLRVIVDAGSFQTDPIEQLIGVFQGCPLSPIIFNLALAPLYDWLGRPEHMAYAYEFKPPDHARDVPPVRLLGTGFADDISIIVTDQVYAQLLLNGTDRFLRWSRSMAAKPSKCFVLALRVARSGAIVQFDPKLEISGALIAIVDPEIGFKFLGGKLFPYQSMDRLQTALMAKLESKLNVIGSSELLLGQKIAAVRMSITGWIGWELGIYPFCLSFAEQCLDPIVKRTLKQWAKLPHSTSLHLFFLDRKSRGLGVPLPSRILQQRQVAAWHTLKHSSDAQVVAFYELQRAKVKADSPRWSAIGVLNEYAAKHPSCASGNPATERQQIMASMADDLNSARLEALFALTVQGDTLRSLGVMAHDCDWLSFITDLPDSILRFGLKAVMDVLPSLANLKRWSIIKPGQERCRLCGRLQTTFHVLSACPSTLGKRRWRHDSVLNALAGFIENRLTPTAEILVDLLHHARSYRVFPPEFGETSRRPDLLIVDRSQRKLAIVELSVPAEENISNRHEKKMVKYQPLLRNVIETLGSGWSVELVAVEVGACGLQSASLSAGFNALKRLGVLNGYERRDARHISARTSMIALRCSYSIWATRKLMEWPEDVSLVT